MNKLRPAGEKKDESLTKIFEELSALIGKYFNDIKDVEKYVNEDLRGQDNRKIQ